MTSGFRVLECFLTWTPNEEESPVLKKTIGELAKKNFFKNLSWEKLSLKNWGDGCV